MLCLRNSRVSFKQFQSSLFKPFYIALGWKDFYGVVAAPISYLRGDEKQAFNVRRPDRQGICATLHVLESLEIGSCWKCRVACLSGSYQYFRRPYSSSMYSNATGCMPAYSCGPISLFLVTGYDGSRRGMSKAHAPRNSTVVLRIQRAWICDFLAWVQSVSLKVDARNRKGSIDRETCRPSPRNEPIFKLWNFASGFAYMYPHL